MTCCVLCMLGYSVFAGGDPRYAGSRAAALSDAYLTQTDLWSFFHNPAGLARLETWEAGVAVENHFLIRELSYGSFAAAVPVGNGTFGAGLTTFGYKTYRDSRASLAYAHSFGPRLSASVRLNYHSIQIDDDYYGSTQTVSADAGLRTTIGDDVVVGAHISNLSQSELAEYQDERIPTVMRLGFAWETNDQLTISGEVEKDSRFDAGFKMGLEYQAVDNVFLRAGARSQPESFSLGLGVHLNSIRIDVASAYNTTLGFSPQASISYRPGL